MKGEKCILKLAIYCLFFPTAEMLNDTKIYNSIISDSAANLRVDSSNTEIKRNVNLTSLVFHLKCLNFRAKRSILDTNKAQKTRQIMANPTGVKRKSR